MSAVRQRRNFGYRNRSCHGFAVTEGLSKVAGYFGDDLCRNSHPFPRTRWYKRSAVRRWPGQSRRLSANTRRARRPGVPSLVPPRGVGADAHDRRPKFRSEIWLAEATPQAHPAANASAPPPVGGGLRPAPLGEVRFRVNFRYFGTPSPRVGADLCVRPDTLPHGTRARADTQVGPYGSYCNLHQTQNNGRGQSPAPTGLS